MENPFEIFIPLTIFQKIFIPLTIFRKIFIPFKFSGKNSDPLKNPPTGYPDLKMTHSLMMIPDIVQLIQKIAKYHDRKHRDLDCTRILQKYIKTQFVLEKSE